QQRAQQKWWESNPSPQLKGEAAEHNPVQSDHHPSRPDQTGGGGGGGLARVLAGGPSIGSSMRRFQESVKALEADIEHANALASEFMRDYDGSVIQMRMAYSAVAHVLVQWTDCRLASALGLLKIMIYKVYAEDGTTTLPSWEREASIREFYGCYIPVVASAAKRDH
uniref:Uncharacterized protein n=1 Tax=Aegilops tauschii subsp. strangulata TaxID=200361 RepID=A0A452YBI9_AEGTS